MKIFPAIPEVTQAELDAVANTAANSSALIHSASVKSPVIDADEIAVSDSATSYSLKKVLWSVVKSTLKTYFDTLYDGIGAATAILSTSITDADTTHAPNGNVIFDALALKANLTDVTGKKVYKFVYDFAVNGGVVGSIPLTQINGALPNKFIVQNAILDVLTPLGSSGAATAALTAGESAGDMSAATLVAGAPYSSTGLKATSILMGTIATNIKTSATRSPSLVVAVSNLNAGKLNLFIEGFQSD